VVDKKQMRGIINDVLQKLGDKYADPKALDLVYNTGLVESKYVYLKQVQGPAVGFMQIEPWVAVSTCKDYLQFREELMKKVADVCNLDWHYFLNPTEEDWRYILTTNIAAQIVFCRIHYWRVPKSLPNTIEEQAKQWKRYYNTARGKGTPEKFIEIVKKYG
tara:strand:- start:768 stop:1250 length:483 start_codon:yes stop_codon:yes gene_type:complete